MAITQLKSETMGVTIEEQAVISCNTRKGYNIQSALLQWIGNWVSDGSNKTQARRGQDPGVWSCVLRGSDRW